MRQIRDMSIMEIDITNACEHRCSNCTRFCGHHKKPYFMDFETFKRAVDSLQGFEGLISTIGGEPLLHPEYDRFAEYLRSVRGDYTSMNDGRCKAIVKDYLAFAKSQRWFEGAMNRGKGYLLFTSMPGNYYQHYEAVEDTVTDLWLNDHTNPSFHQPILVSRKDLGISDEEFEVLRDNCWLQNFWSASITPKGAFFCEIAGTLDLLFNGPGGKKIEPGWWDLDIMEFKDQFHWCDICGMALSTYSRNANEEMDDASPTLLKKLEMIGSPKLKKNRVSVFDIKNADKQDSNSIGSDMGSVTANYLPENEKRVGNAADNLKPDHIYKGIAVGSQKEAENLESKIEECRTTVNGLCIVTLPDYMQECKEKLEKAGIGYKLVLTDKLPSSLGGKMNLMLSEINKQDWLIVSDKSFALPDNYSERVSKYFLNPGYLFVVDHKDTRAVMVSGISATMKKVGYDRIQRCVSLKDVISLWGDKTCVLDDHFEEYADTDIPYFRNIIWKDYEKDLKFRHLLQEKLADEGVKSGENILLLQSAFVYHTLGIYHVLKNLGYQIYILSSHKFKNYFDDVIESDRLICFEEGAFEYDQQETVRNKVRKKAEFAGTIVPFSFGPSTVKHIDDYTDALRTAENITGKILGIINIRRNFIEPEYDIWEER